MKMMNKLNRVLLMAGFATLLGVSTANLAAQGRGNFDPEQARQRMMERVREQFDVKSDDEWKIIEVRVGKVMDAQRDARMGGGFGGRGGGRRGGGDGNAADGGNRRGGGGFGGQTSPEAESLQKAIEAKASAEDIKGKLAKFRDARKVRAPGGDGGPHGPFEVTKQKRGRTK